MPKLAFVLPNWATINKEGIIFYSHLAEELGYDSIWVPETWGNDAFTLLTTIAHNTKTLKFGTGITSVYSRSPAIMAQTISTIDSISGGRAILGLGASTGIVNENWHGIKHEKPVQRTREYVEIIRLILSGKRVNYKGEIFNLKNFSLQSEPLRRNIPIYLASLGSRNLQLTGEIADGWLPFLCSVSHLIELKNEVEKASVTAGRTTNNISICPYVPTLLSDETGQADHKLKEFISFYVGAMGPFYSRLIASYGFEDEANSIRDAWSRKDTAGATESVSNRLLDAVSVNGSRKYALGKLRAFRSETDCPVLIFPFKASREQVVETLKKLAPNSMY